MLKRKSAKRESPAVPASAKPKAQPRSQPRELTADEVKAVAGGPWIKNGR